MVVATYSIDDLSRREILKMSAMIGVASVVSTQFAFAQAALQRTPDQILGPFYPIKPLGKNADLTRVAEPSELRPGRLHEQVQTVEVGQLVGYTRCPNQARLAREAMPLLVHCTVNKTGVDCRTLSLAAKGATETRAECLISNDLEE